MCTSAPVVNVTHNMEVIDGQALDGFGYDDYKGFAVVYGDNRINQTLIVI